MTKRVLICIGVNQYDVNDLDDLNGAEADAENIFAALTNASLGGYDLTLSRLLLSPTLTEVRQVLDEVAAMKPVDTLTVSFAGHGGVNGASYYFCLKNSSSQRLSTTALGMPELLSVINELSPQECNIIIDACEAGGVTIDLGTIIKPDILGASSSPSVSIFCSSSADEVAGDTLTGGIGTIELLKALNGETVVETNGEYLDLVAVGRVVSTRLIAAGKQRPVTWGLNLSGKSRFSKNPCFISPPAHMFIADRISQNSEASKIIRIFSERLLVLSLRPAPEINVKSVYPLLDDVSQALLAGNQGATVPKFIIGIASSLIERVRSSDDVFAPVEVLAACCAVLVSLPQSEGTEVGQNELSRLLFEELSVAFDWLVLEMDEGTLFDAGFADLYLLPIRLTRILGWSAVYMVLAEKLGHHDNGPAIDVVRFVLKTLIALYPLSFSAISDSQTPYLAAFMAQVIKRGWIEECEFIFGSFLSSFLHVKGQITSSDIADEKIAEYIFCRGRNDDYSTLGYSALSKPSEMLTLLLLFSSLAGLEDVTDPYLESIDHLTFNMFVPTTYKDFALCTIPGFNHTYQIGHGVWKVSDFVSHLPELKKDVSKDAVIQGKNMQVMCTSTSFIFPDRCPWFLLLLE